MASVTFIQLLTRRRSRYSDGPGLIPGRERFLSSPRRPNRLWGPPSLLSNGYRWRFPPGVKRPGREADHLPPSSAEVKNGGAIPPLPNKHYLYLFFTQRKSVFCNMVVVYCMTPTGATQKRRLVGWQVHDELEGICLEELWKTTKNFIEESRCPNRDTNVNAP
jgi:hypothetical protein